MCRPETKRPFSLTLILPLCLLAYCGSAQVLGVSRREAAGFLRNGDIDFIHSALIAAKHDQLNLDPAEFLNNVSRVKPLMRIHPAAPFYAGLLAGPELKSLLFSAAMESSSAAVRQESILKLIPMVLESEEEAGNILACLNSIRTKGKAEVLRAACFYTMGLYSDAEKSLSGANEGKWEQALALFAEWKGSSMKQETLRRKISDFLFEPLPVEILTWACGEAFYSEGLLLPGEAAALQARLHRDRGQGADYMAMLSSLRDALQDGGTIFFLHPELIADLGRAYQYTPAMREEGAELFRLWSRLLETSGDASPDERGTLRDISAFIESLDQETGNACKFRTFFYLGRMERAGERYAESSGYFRRALEFAPDSLQSDACIWYMLMNSLALDTDSAVSLTLDTMYKWKDMSYFDDFLDRLSSRLAGGRQWDLLLELFHALEKQPSEGASLSRYAWILGRAAQEGHIKREHRETESQITEASAESFFRMALESNRGPFYYRAMAASKLGAAFIPEGRNGAAEKPGLEKQEMEFLLGFFEYGAAIFALPYIQAYEDKFSEAELEKIAGAFAASGMWKESLDLVSRCITGKDHKLNRRDLLLLYPRPYKELIEKHAAEAELKPEMLYGLIRTESYFMSGAVSRSGATGLAQIMAPTAEEMAGRIARRGGPDYRGPGGIDLKDPEVNIHIGSHYLKYLTEQMGSPMLALLAYNGGMGRLRRALAADKRQKDGGLPLDLFLETIDIHETREYGRRVLAAAAVYGYLYYGLSMEEVALDIYPGSSPALILPPSE